MFIGCGSRASWMSNKSLFDVWTHGEETEHSRWQIWRNNYWSRQRKCWVNIHNPTHTSIYVSTPEWIFKCLVTCCKFMCLQILIACTKNGNPIRANPCTSSCSIKKGSEHTWSGKSILIVRQRIAVVYGRVMHVSIIERQNYKKYRGWMETPLKRGLS
jgi:hypothetical protein